MSGRDPYSKVGAAIREATARANAVKLSSGERQVFAAVVALVASYSRLSDQVYTADVAAAAGVSERWAGECLRRLSARGLIEWEGKRGQSAKSKLGLPKTGSPGVPVSEGGESATGDTPSTGKPERSGPLTGTIRAVNRNAWSSDDREETPRRHPEKNPLLRDDALARASRAQVADPLRELLEELEDSDDGSELAFRSNGLGNLGAAAYAYARAALQLRKARERVESETGFVYGVLSMGLATGRPWEPEGGVRPRSPANTHAAPPVVSNHEGRS